MTSKRLNTPVRCSQHSGPTFQLGRVLAGNIRQNVGVGRYFESITALVTSAGIARSTLYRFFEHESTLDLETVSLIAAAFDVAPWKLFVPGFRAESPSPA